jgi:hypothetical protein
MIKIDYPAHPFKIKKEENKEFIFDEFRKAWVRLTPEEWVRQNFLQFITRVKKYPLSLIAIEKEILLGALTKRFDILVYNSKHQPWMMIECKSMDVVIDQKVMEQLLRYNISVPVPYLVMTNGSYVFGYERREGAIHLLDELPEVE